MLAKLRKRVQRRLFDWTCRDVFSTPPLEPKGSAPIMVSMVCHRDLVMYLLAIKSFYRQLGQGQIVIINDGSLSDKDLRMLRAHVRPAQIFEAKQMSVPGCPGYISWKKLFCIAECLKNEFTIQLDSDTLTLSAVPEVKAHIESNTSFILGTRTGVAIEPIDVVVRAARKSPSDHVQISAERNFDRLPGYPDLRYVRGCSGFDGFGKGSFDLKFLKEFSNIMYGAIGDKWNNWGSEQTTSNYIVANAQQSAVLPFPRYYSYWGKTEPAAFAHFIGTHRYHAGIYGRQGTKVISELAAEALR